MFYDYSMLGLVVRSRRSVLSLAWHELFSCIGKEWKIYCCGLALSSKVQIWKFHVVVWQTTSKIAPKSRAARAARAARSFFFRQPIISLICGVEVAVVVFIRGLKQGRRQRQQQRQKTMIWLVEWEKNHRAARALVQFFDVVCQMTAWNF